MRDKSVLYRKTGRVAFVTLNRPEALNAIDSAMASALVEVLDTIDEDDQVRAVVLTGGGDRAFSVGQDIQELVAEAQDVDDPPTLLWIRGRLDAADPWSRLASLSKPTIAAVNGLALSGGLELALACDVRFAATTATFGFPEVRRGVIPSHGGTQRLPRIVGRGKAVEMLVTGDSIDATEAQQIELVSRVVAAADLERTATELANRLGSYGPLAIQYARDAVTKGLDMTFDQGLHLETDLYALIQTTEDRTEGLRSFREKREPRFEGR